MGHSRVESARAKGISRNLLLGMKQASWRVLFGLALSIGALYPSASYSLPTKPIAVTPTAVEDGAAAGGDASGSVSRRLLQKLFQGVEEFTLPNGLRVLLYRRGTAPVFAGQVWVKVGGVNEQVGRTGAAHLLEHMAFKGTDIIGTTDYAAERVLLERVEQIMDAPVADAADRKAKESELKELYEKLSKYWVDNEFARTYQRHGSTGLNAATSKDYTYYQIELPANALELWCWMESERVSRAVFRQFYKEREVVMEERRMSTDDSPMGRTYEALLATAYVSHPNRFPVIGWPSDVRNLKARDTRELLQTFYRPDNMVVSLVGNFDTARAKELIEKYFGRLERPRTGIPDVTTVEEPQRGERTTTVEFASEPFLTVAFHKPVYPHVDDVHFSVVHSLLADERSSLLYRDLVMKRKIALSVKTSEAPGELYPSLFYLTAVPAPGISLARLRDEIQRSLDRFKTNLVPEADFAAAKKRVRVSFLGGLDSNEELANTLAHAELIWKDWHAIFEMYDHVETMTREDVRTLANRYFNISNRTTIYLQRPAAESPGADKGTPPVAGATAQ